MRHSSILIRQATLSDAKNLLGLRNQLDGETNSMLLEPGERSQDLVAYTGKLAELLEMSNSCILLATLHEQVIGFIQGRGGQFCRDRQTVDIVVGVLNEFHNQGIGRALFWHLEQWAQQQNIHRLELTVMATNMAGIHLYSKMGFQTEGIKREALYVEGQFIDEVVMGKVL